MGLTTKPITKLLVTCRKFPQKRFHGSSLSFFVKNFYLLKHFSFFSFFFIIPPRVKIFALKAPISTEEGNNVLKKRQRRRWEKGSYEMCCLFDEKGIFGRIDGNAWGPEWQRSQLRDKSCLAKLFQIAMRIFYFIQPVFQYLFFRLETESNPFF